MFDISLSPFMSHTHKSMAQYSIFMFCEQKPAEFRDMLFGVAEVMEMAYAMEARRSPVMPDIRRAALTLAAIFSGRE